MKRNQKNSSLMAALSALDFSEINPKSFIVEYNDLHAFHGGKHITILGDGSVDQKYVREKTWDIPKLNRKELEFLKKLLLTYWFPKEPMVFSQLNPDSSFAKLSIRLNNMSSTIIEPYNDSYLGCQTTFFMHFIKDVIQHRSGGNINSYPMFFNECMKLMHHRDPQLQENGFFTLKGISNYFIADLKNEIANEKDPGLKKWLLTLTKTAEDL